MVKGEIIGGLGRDAEVRTRGGITFVRCDNILEVAGPSSK